jgi:hypothetical protein
MRVPTLQAVLFHETGRTWLTPKPWELASGAGSLTGSSSSSSSGGIDGSSQLGKGTASIAWSSGRWVESERELPASVAAHLKWLRGAADSDSGAASALIEHSG